MERWKILAASLFLLFLFVFPRAFWDVAPTMANSIIMSGNLETTIHRTHQKDWGRGSLLVCRYVTNLPLTPGDFL